MALRPIYEASWVPEYWFDTSLKLEGWFDQEYFDSAAQLESGSAVGRVGFTASAAGSKQAVGDVAGAVGLTDTSDALKASDGSAVGNVGLAGNENGGLPPADTSAAGDVPRRRPRLVVSYGEAVGAVGLTGSASGVAAPNWEPQNTLELLLLAA